MYVEHPLIRPGTVLERDYQRNLAEACVRSSTLLVLPTGLGKTVVALRVAAEVLESKGGKALFLAPTKPLVVQLASYLREHLAGRTVDLVTGENPPRDRVAIWQGSDVIVATPQTVANDLRRGELDLAPVSLIVFDEAHRAVGNYAYVEVAKRYQGLVLGLTASPGATRKRIAALCRNLGVEALEWREEGDDDVAPYVHGVDIEWREVDPPAHMGEVVEQLRELHRTSLDQLVGMRLVKADRPATVPYLLQVNRSIQARMGRGNRGYLFRALSAVAAAIKVAHALELAETQSTAALARYLDKLRREAASKGGSRASKNIASSPQLARVTALLEEAGEHPKMRQVERLVAEQLASRPTSRVMVFTNYRDSCDAVVTALGTIDGVRVSRLVGQAPRFGDAGQRQGEQVGVLSKLRNGQINVVVATCIGEEGLDVADTDLVIFYEPVPSEIRSIQRRGRTGRSGPGRVVVLVTRGTRDVTSLQASVRKEGTMHRQLARLKAKKELLAGPADQEEGVASPA